MKKFLMAIGGSAILVLGACGGGGDEAAEDEGAVDEGAVEEGGEEAAEGTVDVAAGQDIFENNCATCHGANLEGGGGPALVDNDYDPEFVEETIENGASGMPAGLVEGEEREQVAAWVAQQ